MSIIGIDRTITSNGKLLSSSLSYQKSSYMYIQTLYKANNFTTNVSADTI